MVLKPRLNLDQVTRILRMSPICEIDHLLGDIAAPLAREADTLLDLREAATSASHPGRCVSCYFKLLAASPQQVSPRLTPLREWLESRIEITATGDEGLLLETLPLHLDAPDLESCCRRVMDAIFEDRSYVHARTIGLQFRFRPAVATA